MNYTLLSLVWIVRSWIVLKGVGRDSITFSWASLFNCWGERSMTQIWLWSWRRKWRRRLQLRCGKWRRKWRRRLQLRCRKWRRKWPTLRMSRWRGKMAHFVGRGQCLRWQLRIFIQWRFWRKGQGKIRLWFLRRMDIQRELLLQWLSIEFRPTRSRSRGVVELQFQLWSTVIHIFKLHTLQSDSEVQELFIGPPGG